MLKEAIKTVLQSGGSVSAPYKRRIPDWFGEVKITRLSEAPVLRDKAGKYFVEHPYGSEYFDDADVAIKFFYDKVWSKSNLALIYAGIRAHHLTDKDFDDLNRKQIGLLINQYLQGGYFESDYPFVEQDQPTPNLQTENGTEN